MFKDHQKVPMHAMKTLSPDQRQIALHHSLCIYDARVILHCFIEWSVSMKNHARPNFISWNQFERNFSPLRPKNHISVTQNAYTYADNMRFLPLRESKVQMHRFKQATWNRLVHFDKRPKEKNSHLSLGFIASRHEKIQCPADCSRQMSREKSNYQCQFFSSLIVNRFIATICVKFNAEHPIADKWNALKSNDNIDVVIWILLRRKSQP